MASIKQVTATGDVTTDDSYLRAAVLSGGSDAATLVVRAGGSSGTQVLTLKVAAASSVSTGQLDEAFCGGGIHATLTGTSPAASFVYE